MTSTRLAFPAILAVAVVVALSGIAFGVEARIRDAERFAGTTHTGAAHRQPRSRMPVERAVAPPLPLSPRYGEEVAEAPTIAWRLMDGTSGARLELCPTLDFDDATTKRIDVDGDRAQLPLSWPAGVWYWRLRGRAGRVVGDRATPTWMVYVAARADDQG